MMWPEVEQAQSAWQQEDDKNIARCRYLGTGGEQCQQDVVAVGDLCFWHNPQVYKTGRDIRTRLEEWAASGLSMEGFQLARANLQDIHLSHGQAEVAVNLAHADLSRTNLSGAHLYNADLHGASLLKADLSHANLNRAHLEDANLLGARLYETRLKYARWGRHIRQEREAYAAERAGDRERARALYIEAEEIYRNLTRVSERGGHSEREGWFFRKEMIMRRRQYPLLSLHRGWMKLVDLVCGYGELPARVIGFSLSVIFASALIYFLYGVNSHGGNIGWVPGAGWWRNTLEYLTCVYFSVVTFTTLGYGDIAPLGVMRAVAGAEAFVGAFTMALFVVVFDKKMTR
ncbi:MAG: pentapeptide repeat-containing protein [Candidatus Lambdaproteobacteria bacterium]|nr:pentapeptide repeat-containing protein [Candidatus Lambdaproteobacteria bacterium]